MPHLQHYCGQITTLLHPELHCGLSTAPIPLQYPVTHNKRLRPAPLLHTRPDFKQITSRGGLKSAARRAQLPQWAKSLPATLRVMRRWDPNNPLLSMDRAARNKILLAAWEAGFKAGAGYKP